jgi:hypothetical protein
MVWLGRVVKLGCGGALAAAVGVAFDDELVAGGDEPVDGGLGQQRVWDAFATGGLVDFGTGNAAGDDPVDGGDWGPHRQVRAEVVSALLCGAVVPEPGRAGRVWLRCASITGVIDLRDAEVKHALRLERCHVGDGVNLADATGRAIMLVRCQLGAVNLLGANITGRLSFSGSQLAVGDGPALVGDGLSVTGEWPAIRRSTPPERSGCQVPVSGAG